MRLRTDSTGRWSEDADLVDPLCIVPDSVSVQQLRQILTEAFPHRNEAVVAFEVPLTFNLLTEWIPGDLRWPLATMLLRKGLVDGVVYSTKQVSELLGRTVKSVENVTRPAGHQSYVTLLGDAHYFCGGVARPNELRRIGLWSQMWTSLARSEVWTVDSLCSMTARQLLAIDGVHQKTASYIIEILAAQGRSLQV